MRSVQRNKPGKNTILVIRSTTILWMSSTMSYIKLISIFAGIAILISCLGLFGLATYTAQVKVKEIGIRKVLGASVAHITAMLSKDFLILVFTSLIIASPIAWYF